MTALRTACEARAGSFVCGAFSRVISLVSFQCQLVPARCFARMRWLRINHDDRFSFVSFFFFAQRLKGNVLLEEWIVSVGI